MKDLIVDTILMLLLVGLLMTFGCQSQQKDNGPPPSGPEVLYRTIVKTNWLATAAIIGIGASAFAFLSGSKFGLAGIVSCFITLTMTLATARYAAWFAISGMIGSIGLLVYMIFIKNRALKEIVRGGEDFKIYSDKEFKPFEENPIPYNFNIAQQNAQSPSTQKIVKKLKDKK